MPKIAGTSRARSLRRSQTSAELKLWKYLRNRHPNGFKFKRQVPRGKYFVDFLCDEAKLIVEVDRGQHADQRAYDAVRTAVLERDGYRVIRFWNIDVPENLDGVLETVAQTLAARSAQ